MPWSPICGPGSSAKRLQGQQKKVAEVIYSFFTSKGYNMSRGTFATAMAASRSIPASRPISAYMQHDAEVLLKEKKISAIPDWKKALRPDFMDEGARRLKRDTAHA